MLPLAQCVLLYDYVSCITTYYISYDVAHGFSEELRQQYRDGKDGDHTHVQESGFILIKEEEINIQI